MGDVGQTRMWSVAPHPCGDGGDDAGELQQHLVDTSRVGRGLEGGGVSCLGAGG